LLGFDIFYIWSVIDFDRKIFFILLVDLVIDQTFNFPALVTTCILSIFFLIASVFNNFWTVRIFNLFLNSLRLHIYYLIMKIVILLKIRPQIFGPFYGDLLKIAYALNLIFIKDEIYARLKFYDPMQHDLDIKLLRYLFFIWIYLFSNRAILTFLTIKKLKDDKDTVTQIFT